jgi:hypothetical protein
VYLDFFIIVTNGYDERGFPVSCVLSFLITTSRAFPSRASCRLSSRRTGVSRLARCNERGVPVSRILMFVIATSGGFPSGALRRVGRSRLTHLDVYHRNERGFLSRALRRAGRSRLAHLDVCYRDERGFPVSRIVSNHRAR